MVQRTFPRPIRRPGWFWRVQSLLRSYFDDGKYDLAAVKEAFSHAGSPSPMFRPQIRSIKIAVSATTTDKAESRLFTNYNGALMNSDVKYEVLRHSKPAHDVTAGDA